MKLIKWISASAGSGKTTYIINSVSRLLTETSKPKSILCISFTNTAIKTMKEKLLNQSLSEPVFCTIHALGKEMLNSSGYKIATANDTEEIVRQAFNNILSDDKWFNLVRAIFVTNSSFVYEIQNIVLSENIDNIKAKIKNLQLKQIEKVIITLQTQTILELTQHGYKSLYQDMISNNINRYYKFITKNLKLKQNIINEKFFAKFSKESARNLKSAFHMIIQYMKQIIDNQFLEKTIVFNELIIAVSEEYVRLKQELNVKDFNDLISSVSFNANFTKSIQHVFLDEAQDTNSLQQKFLLNLVEEIIQHDEFSITIVGDSKQAIYEYNDSNNNAYQTFKETLQKFAKIMHITFVEESLHCSYRVPSTVMNFTKNIMLHNDFDISIHDKGTNKLGKVKVWHPIQSKIENAPACQWTFVNKIETPTWITIFIDECKKLISSGVKYSDISLLFQKRCVWLNQLIYALEENNIPITEYPMPITTNNIIYELTMLAMLAMDQSHDSALAVILKGPFCRLSDNELLDLCDQRNDSLLNCMSKSKSQKIQALYKEIQCLISFEQDTLHFFSNILFHTQYGKFLYQHFTNEVNLFWEHVLTFSYTGSSLAKYLEYLSSTTNQYILNNKGIKISTIHNFKGRESEHVFLCNLHVSPIKNIMPIVQWNGIILFRDHYPLYENIKTKQLSHESKMMNNLLYVAMTRTKNTLYILPPPDDIKIFHDSLYSRIINNIEKCANENYEIAKVKI